MTCTGSRLPLPRSCSTWMLWLLICNGATAFVPQRRDACAVCRQVLHASQQCIGPNALMLATAAEVLDFAYHHLRAGPLDRGSSARHESVRLVTCAEPSARAVCADASQQLPATYAHQLREQCHTASTTIMSSNRWMPPLCPRCTKSSLMVYVSSGSPVLKCTCMHDSSTSYIQGSDNGGKHEEDVAAFTMSMSTCGS